MYNYEPSETTETEELMELNRQLRDLNKTVTGVFSIMAVFLGMAVILGIKFFWFSWQHYQIYPTGIEKVYSII